MLEVPYILNALDKQQQQQQHNNNNNNNNNILSQSYLFVLVAVETMGAINEAGMNFLGDLEGASINTQMITTRAPSFSNAFLL